MNGGLAARSLLRGLLWTLVLAPLVLHLAALPEYGRLQRSDYYAFVHQLFDGVDGLSDDPADWWRVHINTHRVTVPALIWGANLVLFDGHNLTTALLGLGFLVGIALLVGRRMPSLDTLRPASETAPDASAARPPPEAGLLPAAIASVVLLHPLAAHNVARSFAAIHTFGATLLGILVLVTIERRAAGRGPIWPLLPLAVAGPLTFSSELVTWPAALAGALLLRLRRRDLAMVVAATAVTAAIYLTGRPPSLPPSLPGPGVVLGFVGTFLGAPFSQEMATARWLGWTLLALAVAAQAAAFLRASDRRRVVFWSMVLLYAGGCGLLAALARGARFGAEGGLSVRYAVYPTLFLLATVATLVCCSRRRRRATWVVAGALALALVPSYRWGLRVMEISIEEGRRQPLAEMGVRLGLEDIWYLRLVSINWRDHLAVVPKLEALGHVPFDRPAPELPGPLAIAPLAPAGREVGILEHVGGTSRSDLVYVKGRLERGAGGDPHDPGEILFLDPDGRRSSVTVVYQGFDDPKLLHWDGFALWQGPDGPGAPYLRRAGDDRLVALRTIGRARDQIGRLAVSGEMTAAGR